MFRFLLLLVIFGFELTALNNPFLKIPDCKIYKKGIFFYNSINGFQYTVLREDKWQKVYIKDSEQYIKHNIRWETDCKYRLTITDITDPYIKDQFKSNIEIGETFLIEITKNRTKDFYEYSYIGIDGRQYFNRMFVFKK